MKQNGMNRMTLISSLQRAALSALFLTCIIPSVFADDPLPPVSAKATTARVLELKVDPVDQSQLVLLDRGLRHGVANGDVFAILRNEKKIGQAKVFAVFNDICSARLIKRNGTVKKGDVAVRLKKGKTNAKANTKSRPGKVTAAPANTDLLQISLGTQDGLKVGDILTIYRINTAVGTVRVIDCRKNRCTARYLEYVLPAKLPIFRVGDLARRSLSSQPKKVDPNKGLRKKAQSIMKDAERIRAQARQLEAQAKALRDQARKLEEEAAALTAKKAVTIPSVFIPELGVAVTSSKVFATGVQIVRVDPGSVSERAGLKKGEVIFQFNDKKIKDAKALLKDLQNLKEGAAAKFSVMGENGPRAFRIRVKSSKEKK
ncbi:MAG: PDZ domain-containing protein [Planctomycetota bacterium]|nr:PDZ domain-containing protein [Planctomycetota bacterium]